MFVRTLSTVGQCLSEPCQLLVSVCQNPVITVGQCLSEPCQLLVIICQNPVKYWSMFVRTLSTVGQCLSEPCQCLSEPCQLLVNVRALSTCHMFSSSGNNDRL
ncbi:unnamed protein product [Candidula unifasciata]|uniref:Uncharacterized protein n=1 Tax=Candidula unifasciata TaxID=100452 RepID=A0A8S3Z6J6_9EUPU|nr:unnamed protein product [Candidula unifasciata]